MTVPPEILTPLLGLGLPGIIIAVLIWALVRKDRQVEMLQEARIIDQKDKAQEILRAAAAVESLNQATKQREEANDLRWRVMEGLAEVCKGTARAVEGLDSEITRIGRVVDASSMRLERIERGRGVE